VENNGEFSGDQHQDPKQDQEQNQDQDLYHRGHRGAQGKSRGGLWKIMGSSMVINIKIQNKIKIKIKIKVFTTGDTEGTGKVSRDGLLVFRFEAILECPISRKRSEKWGTLYFVKSI
jgi:hypothetical protein